VDRRQGIDDRPARGAGRKAAADGAQIIGFQELFYGPYFGIVQDQKYYDYVETIPGPTTTRFQALAAELEPVDRAAIYEVETRRVLQHRRVIDADGSFSASTANPHPQLRRFQEKFSSGRAPGLPGVRHGDRPVGVYICYDPAFPEGWRRVRSE